MVVVIEDTLRMAIVMMMLMIMMMMLMMMITYWEAHGVGHIGSIATVEILLLNLNPPRIIHTPYSSSALKFHLMHLICCKKYTSSISAVRVISWSVNCPQAT